MPAGAEEADYEVIERAGSFMNTIFEFEGGRWAYKKAKSPSEMAGGYA